MKNFRLFIFLIFLSPSLAGAQINDSPRGEFTGRKEFRMLNFTLLVVDCSTLTCSYDQQQKTKGWIKRVPYDDLELNIAGQRFMVTNKKVGNNELMVNKVIYQFSGQEQHVLIDVHGKISIEPGGCTLWTELK